MMPSVSRSPLRTPGTVSKERDDKAGSTADVPGFGLAVVLFLPGAAYLGITNGHDFIENDFFRLHVPPRLRELRVGPPALLAEERQLVRRPGLRPHGMVPVAVHHRAGRHLQRPADRLQHRRPGPVPGWVHRRRHRRHVLPRAHVLAEQARPGRDQAKSPHPFPTPALRDLYEPPYPTHLIVNGQAISK